MGTVVMTDPPEQYIIIDVHDALLLAHAHSSAHVTHKAATPLTNGGGNQIY